MRKGKHFAVGTFFFLVFSSLFHLPSSIFFLASSLFPLPSSLFLLSPLGEARADEFKLIPSLRLQGEYNDNIFFSSTDRREDFLTTVSPGVEVVSRTETLDLSLLARANVLRYARNDELDDVEQNYRGRLRFAPNPTWKLSADAGYTRDSRPDRDIAESGLVLRPVTRKRQNYGGGAEAALSERTRAALTYAYEKSDFDDPGFVDVRAHDAGLSFLHDLSRHFSATTGRVSLNYGRYEFPGNIVNTYYATLGILREISETWKVQLDAGGSYTRSEFDAQAAGGERKKGEAGWVGSAALSYNGEKGGGDLTFSHRVMPAVGRGGAVRRTSAVVQGRTRFTYELSGRVWGGYYLNRADSGELSAAPIRETTWRGGAALRYDFTRDTGLEFSYSYAWVRDEEANTDARRSLFLLLFTIQHQFFE